jgi:RNA-directed DNA polymerase
MIYTPDGSAQKGPSQRSILDMNCKEAAAFLLKEESYCRIDLPQYFRFEKVLTDVVRILEVDSTALACHRAGKHEGVNHSILSSKDGRYAWRPLQLIHPVLYIALVRRLTEPTNWDTLRDWFRGSADAARICCLSVPVESLSEEADRAAQVAHWWDVVEQGSIEAALRYEYVAHADIVDCYGSIYTHSIPWAIHGKATAQANKRDQALVGNTIDRLLQDMHLCQTNGILNRPGIAGDRIP